MRTITEIVNVIEKDLQCRCDLDKWQPNNDTGHSWVCPIDQAARDQQRRDLRFNE